jgi:hypothetical protein
MGDPNFFKTKVDKIVNCGDFTWNKPWDLANNLLLENLWHFNQLHGVFWPEQLIIFHLEKKFP